MFKVPKRSFSEIYKKIVPRMSLEKFITKIFSIVHDVSGIARDM